MELTHYTIKLLNAVFVASAGVVALLLLFASILNGTARMSSPKQRAERLLTVMRDGAVFLSMPLRKRHYRIGRSPECDIPLKGPGIPPVLCDIFINGGEWNILSHTEDSIAIKGERPGKNKARITIGEKIMLYNYSISIK